MVTTEEFVAMVMAAVSSVEVVRVGRSGETIISILNPQHGLRIAYKVRFRTVVSIIIVRESTAPPQLLETKNGPHT